MADLDERRDVEAKNWAIAVRAARDEGFTHFDWLGCVDDIGRNPSFVVVLRLLRPDALTDAVRISTRVPRDRPELSSIADLFAGAAWHERESAELFDLTFVGGDHRRLLLDVDAEVGPLRKDQVLAARSAQVWPGSTEPGETTGGASIRSGRRRQTAPGVPDPQVWGDRGAAEPAAAEDVVDSTDGGRGRRRP